MIIKVKKELMKTADRTGVFFEDKDSNAHVFLETRGDDYVITMKGNICDAQEKGRDYSEDMYELRVKEFVAENHPVVSLQEYRMEHFIRKGIEKSVANSSFVSTQAMDLDLYDENLRLECIRLTLRFRDFGARHECHVIKFDDIAQISSPETGFEGYGFRILPETIYEVCADEDGCFDLSLNFILREAETDELPDLKDVIPTVFFQFITVSNQFAEETFALIGDAEFSVDDSFTPADSFVKGSTYYSLADE